MFEQFSSELESRVKRYQVETFGSRYLGANLRQLTWPEPDTAKVLNFLKNPKDFLVILGMPDNSKTHFCAALSEWILTTFNKHRYWQEAKLYERLQEGFNSNEGSAKHLKYMIDDHLLILDDVGSCGWSQWKEGIFYQLVAARYECRWPTIITSNLTRSQFYEIYEKRIPSRLFSKENTIIELVGSQNYRNS